MRSELFIIKEEATGQDEMSPGFVDGRDDDALVEAAQQGDAEAFGVLVDRYHAQVYGIVLRMCGPENAEDITQEIFVKALTALRHFRFRAEASFRTWLYRIAVNTAVNELRQWRRRRAVTGPSLDEPVRSADGPTTHEVGDSSSEPYRLIEQSAQQQAVREVLMMLTAKQRATLVLVDLQGLNYEEAAQVLGCPLGTMKSRLMRARAAFANKFKQYQPEWVPGSAASE